MNINIKENKYNFDLKDLVEIGGRLNNPKRNFLFISKILGKHLLVNPDICKITGYLLANLMYEDNNFDIDLFINAIKDFNQIDKNVLDRELEKSIKTNEKLMIIGFAETATALGMSTACAIENSYYANTTRELIKDVKSFFNFEEEHSHATSHKCYLKDLRKLETADRVVLIDDEITTGNTMLNLIKEFNKIYPNKKYTILTILDFRNEEYLNKYEEFKREYDLDIDVKSFITATIENTSNEILTNDSENLASKSDIYKNMDLFKKETHCLLNDEKFDYIKSSGRFGISFNEIREIENTSKEIAKFINVFEAKKRICVLGHGEDIYIPSRIASYLDGQVMFKTTTRSPIFVKDEENYPIKERTKFNLDDVTYYLYNKTELEKEFDEVFVISEFDIKHKLTKNSSNIKL